MRQRMVCAAVILLATAFLTATAAARAEPSDQKTEAELIRLERAKWEPGSFSSAQEFIAQFAGDFVSVQYGADIAGGVQRKTRQEVFLGAPLPPAKFELAEWHAVHASGDVVVLSYRVIGVSFPWKAYATSVWALRNGKWKTVFYQASTAK